MGYKMTDKHKKKIGEAVKRGTVAECSVCRKGFYLTKWEANRKYPRRCCSRECFKIRYKKNFSKKGKSNHFWKGGINLDKLKKQALTRDNYMCLNCGFSEKEIMEVDHIKERKFGGTNKLENLQTLCPNCHRRKTNRFLKSYKRSI
jgi:5-methylcytosine-specific restriction protein A